MSAVYYREALVIVERTLVEYPTASLLDVIKQVRREGPHSGLKEAKDAVDTARERGHLRRADDGVLTITARGHGYIEGLGDTLAAPTARGGLGQLLHAPRQR